jgi:DNA-binding protein HU-beta
MDKGTFLRGVTRKNKKAQLTQKLYNQVLNDLLNGIQMELAAGRSVRFIGFGTFYTRKYKGGTARNFKTKEPVKYKEGRVAAFRPGEPLRKAVKHKKGLFGR